MSLATITTIILCGGLGTRLREKVSDRQKAMAQVSGKPFLDILLKYLERCGFRDIVLCTGHQADSVEQHYSSHKTGLDIRFSRENSPLGTGGALKHARALINSELFFVLNGDSFCPLDYEGMRAFHSEKQAQITIALSRAADAGDYGTVVCDDNAMVQAFLEKQPSGSDSQNFVNAGIYCMNKTVFDLMPGDLRFSLEKDFFPAALEKGVHGYVTGEPFIDIGTPQRLEQAQQEMERKTKYEEKG